MNQQNHPWSALRIALLACVTFFSPSSPCDADDNEPSDPLASIDGKPVYLGELNLILADRLGRQNVQRATAEIRQAAAVILLRRHLAMRSLRSKSDAIGDVIDREFTTVSNVLRRQGSSAAEFAEQRSADERSLKADLAWKTAWRWYLKNRMTDANLRKFFLREKVRFDGGRWDVSQIFLPVDAKDSNSIATTTGRMKELADQIRSAETSGQAFAAAAREHSEAGSAEEGGRIGWVSNSGDLPPQVIGAVREMNEGDISDPIRSSLGLHLVILHKYEPGTLTFETLTDQAQLRRDAADSLFDALVQEQSEATVRWHINELRPPVPIR